MISIINPLQSTYIFIAILVVAIILSVRRQKTVDLLPPATTQELKGLAILAIVFSHVGYFLVSDHRFLFPLSIMAGVGLNLFLFLSGYGLVVSALKKPLAIGQFYGRRLSKLYLPFWLVLLAIIVVDWLALGRVYGYGQIISSFIGWFPRADLWLDINSPFWYFSLILFYYLIFPWLFIKKAPWLSALLIYLITYFVIKINPSWLADVIRLYKVHLLAFPIGMAVGSWFYQSKFCKQAIGRLKNLNQAVYGLVILGLLGFIAYTAYYSGVGASAWTEQSTSLLTMAAILLLFLIKKIRVKLFYIFGLVSYEIYLVHWPILSRYDMLFKNLPAWLAMLIYLAVFLILGWLLQKISGRLIKKTA